MIKLSYWKAILLSMVGAVLVSCSKEDNSLSPPPGESLATFWRNEPLIGSHRGHYLYPENTFEGIKAAIEAGFLMIEFDIQRTKDGVLVIHHDTSIDRCSNGSGEISEMSYEELNQYDYGSWKGEQYAGIKLATLESVLQLVKQSNVLVELDLLSHNSTSTVINDVFDLVANMGLVDRVSFNVSIYNAPRICEMSNNTAHISVQFPGETRYNEIFPLTSSNHVTYCSIRKDRLTDEIVTQCKKNDVRIEVFGVKTPVELDSYLMMGSDYVMVEDFIPNGL